MITNLLSNAIKFTEQGSVTVRYEVTRKQEHLSLKFSVTDTGVGISRPAQQHLFDSFTQADSSTTREFGGTGLGLAISKQLCELMGGDVFVTSQKDKGSTFSFIVKLGSPKSQSTDAATSKPETKGFETGIHALLVEDNEINQQVMLAILETLDIEAEDCQRWN